MAYPNIAGTTVALTDGNLRQINRTSEPGVLVIGRAQKGPTSNITTLASIADAAATFGKQSDVFRGVAEASQGGASNILAYRLAGVAPVATNIGADRVNDPTATGITITPALESAEAGSIYAVAFQSGKHFNSTPGSPADEVETTNELVVLNLQTGKVVFHGTESQTFIDLGEVTVAYDEFDVNDDIDVITITFSGNATAAGSFEFVISGQSIVVDVENLDTPTDIALNLKDEFDLTELASVFTMTLSGGVATITANKATSADGYLKYPSGHPYAGRAARPVVIGAVTTGTPGTTFAINKTAGSPAFDVGVLPLYTEDPLSSVNGGAFFRLDQLPILYAQYEGLYTNVASEAYTAKTVFTEGQTLASTSLMKLYEKLDEAYNLLSFRSFDFVVPQGAILNAVNIADLEGSDITALGLASLTDYPVAGNAKDVLGKMAKVLNDDGFTYTYYWDVDNDGVAEIASDGDLVGAPDDLVFNEVNFAHQLALFCYKTSAEFNFCHGVIGTTTPRTLDPRTIRNWAGKSPVSVYDGRLDKYIIPSGSNGQGLLGNKLVGGHSDFYFGYRRPGIPLTTDEIFSSMNDADKFVVDANGVTVDLGKYLSVVAAFGSLRNEFNSVRGGYLTNLAGWYAGKITTLAPAAAPTNKVANGVGMIYEIDPRIVDELAGNRLVALFKKDGVPTIPDAPTFAVEGSDYKRLTTMRIVHTVVKQMRAAADPFLGEGLTTQKRAALDTALQGIILQNMGTNLTSGNFTVKQTAAERVEGRMRLYLSLVPVFELRKINAEISLSAGE